MPRKSPNPVIFEPDIEQLVIFKMIEQITWSLETFRFKVWVGLLATDFMVVEVWLGSSSSSMKNNLNFFKRLKNQLHKRLKNMNFWRYKISNCLLNLLVLFHNLKNEIKTGTNMIRNRFDKVFNNKLFRFVKLDQIVNV